MTRVVPREDASVFCNGTRTTSTFSESDYNSNEKYLGYHNSQFSFYIETQIISSPIILYKQWKEFLKSDPLYPVEDTKVNIHTGLPCVHAFAMENYEVNKKDAALLLRNQTYV